MPSIEGRGWKGKEGRIKPAWLLADQVSGYLSQKRRIKAKGGSIADSEEQEEDQLTSLKE